MPEVLGQGDGRMKRRKTTWEKEIAEVNAKARKQGMSYGKYAGLLYSEEQAEMARRRRYEEKRRRQLG